MRLNILTTVAAFLLGLAIDAGAIPITFTDTGIGSGSLNGVNFSNLSFTISATDDTSNIVTATPSGSMGVHFGYLDVNNSATIEISGLGTYTFLTETGFWVEPAGTYDGITQTGQLVGFSQIAGTNQYIGDLYDGPISSVFSSWDLQTSIGPVPGTEYLVSGWSNDPIQTTGGTLFFDQGTTSGIFTAVVDTAPVPEPSTIFFFCAGLAGLGLFRRRANK